MNVNKKLLRRFGILAVVAAAVVLLVGCPTDSDDNVSVSDRIGRLESDLNNNYSQVYLNWHPDSTTRQAAANPQTLEATFPFSDSGSYAVSNIVVDGSNATATLRSNVLYGSGTALVFTMQQSGDDWFIATLTINALTLNSIWEQR